MLQTTIIIAIFLTSVVQSGVVVKVLPDCSYVVLVGNALWLKNASSSVQADHHHHSTLDETLVLVEQPMNNAGADKLGDWTEVICRYGRSSHQPMVDFSIRTYASLDIIIFGQRFLVSLTNTSIGNKEKLISKFPSFMVNGNGNLGLLHYADVFFWSGNSIQRWQEGMKQLKDGLEGGPLVLFDKSDSAIVISAFNQFMASSQSHDNISSTLSWGIMGDVNYVPKGYSLQTILCYSDQGINKAMEKWGEVLMSYYDKDPTLRYQDPTVKYLGYYTDNGGYYYHLTEPGMNYEETLMAVQDYAKNENIPYRYWQLDDWWYYIAGSGYGATVKWDAMPNIFPSGFRSFYNKTGLPIVAHNRYWSAKTVYAKENGGQFDFLIEGENSLPIQQEFWDYLFSQAIQWGLTVYEQDWLNTQVTTFTPLHSDVYLGRKWLMQMGEAASRYGIRIQYCMALPRHVLQSVEIPTVTQIRSSLDYHLREDQWKIGISSMLSSNLGLAPFKDNFWSKSVQPGNPYNNKTEPSPLLQGVVSLLSTGPVGPSDRLAYSNASLITRFATADGLLLKPSKAATAINAQILQSVFGGDVGPEGEVWTTYSDISGFRFGIILAADITRAYNMGPEQAGFGKDFGMSVLYDYKMDASAQEKLVGFSESSPLAVSTDCTRESFCLHYTSPVMWIGQPVAVLGELSKMVPMSPQRVTSIEVSDLDLQVSLIGSPGEKIKFYFYYGDKWIMITCDISDTGKATISLAGKMCT